MEHLGSRKEDTLIAGYPYLNQLLIVQRLGLFGLVVVAGHILHDCCSPMHVLLDNDCISLEISSSIPFVSYFK